MTGRAAGRLVVVGAGPAGLAAAVAAADAGATVTVVDLGQRPGGQYLRQPLVAGVPPARHSRRAETLLGRALAHRRITFLARHQVWWAGTDATPADGAAPPAPGAGPAGGAPAPGAGPHGGTSAPGGVTLRLLGPAGPVTLTAPAVVLAPGGYDRVVPFPGWDLPGVVTAGAAQALAKGQGVLVGRRVLVAGTGPFLLTVAAGLARAGARVAAVVEAAPLRRWARQPRAVVGAPGKLVEAARYLATLRRYGVPVRRGRAVTEVTPDGDGLRATIRRVDAGWRPAGGGTRTARVDAVCVGHGFTPSIELAVALGCATRVDPADGSPVVAVDGLGRSSVPGVLVAGEATGVGGAELAISTGELAGLAAAHRLGLLDDAALARTAAPALRRAAGQRRFAAALHRAYPVPDGWTGWLRPETVLCRCEEVTAGELRGAVRRYGVDDVRALKLVTRIGMGPCQGRVCGRAATCLLAAASGRDQPPEAFANRQIVMPVPLGAVAEEGTPQ
ncbi:NAD(P)/FAD-dependent oxidoreductase [Micromonospora sp. NPDC049559]|uniref:FAD/NAD(P)-dependent oxidoreductase n=1 Tax=Micromonospora sp. NPDC049559 TaxID=3155923 RepID=UPI0034259F93